VGRLWLKYRTHPSDISRNAIARRFLAGGIAHLRGAFGPSFEFGEEHARSVAVNRKDKKMKESTKDELKGKAHEVKGAVKQTVGRLADKPKLEAEGLGEKVAGTIQKKVGQIEKVLEN
jgi:uncharacterized protein YjbJ (UPF0337 family)